MMDYQIEDVAVQAWVLEHQGIKLHSIALAVIDSNFVYRGKGDYRGLFQYEAVTDRARRLYPEIPKWVKQFSKVLVGAEPGIPMGRQCREPFECPFQKYCSRFLDKAKFPVNLLPNWGNIVEELVAEGYRDLRDVPVGRLINAIMLGIVTYDSNILVIQQKK